VGKVGALVGNSGHSVGRSSKQRVKLGRVYETVGNVGALAENRG
jgi:hypothetical protein